MKIGWIVLGILLLFSRTAVALDSDDDFASQKEAFESETGLSFNCKLPNDNQELWETNCSKSLAAVNALAKNSAEFESLKMHHCNISFGGGFSNSDPKLATPFYFANTHYCAIDIAAAASPEQISAVFTAEKANIEATENYVKLRPEMDDAIQQLEAKNGLHVSCDSVVTEASQCASLLQTLRELSSHSAALDALQSSNCNLRMVDKSDTEQELGSSSSPYWIYFHKGDSFTDCTIRFSPDATAAEINAAIEATAHKAGFNNDESSSCAATPVDANIAVLADATSTANDLKKTLELDEKAPDEQVVDYAKSILSPKDTLQLYQGTSEKKASDGTLQPCSAWVAMSPDNKIRFMYIRSNSELSRKPASHFFRKVFSVFSSREKKAELAAEEEAEKESLQKTAAQFASEQERALDNADGIGSGNLQQQGNKVFYRNEDDGESSVVVKADATHRSRYNVEQDDDGTITDANADVTMDTDVGVVHKNSACSNMTLVKEY